MQGAQAQLGGGLAVVVAIVDEQHASGIGDAGGREGVFVGDRVGLAQAQAGRVQGVGHQLAPPVGGIKGIAQEVRGVGEQHHGQPRGAGAAQDVEDAVVGADPHGGVGCAQGAQPPCAGVVTEDLGPVGEIAEFSGVVRLPGCPEGVLEGGHLPAGPLGEVGEAGPHGGGGLSAQNTVVVDDHGVRAGLRKGSAGQGAGVSTALRDRAATAAARRAGSSAIDRVVVARAPMRAGPASRPT